MNFSKHFAFVAVAVLVVFSGQSDANILTFIANGAQLLQTAGNLAVNAIGDGISAIASSIENQITEIRRTRPAEKAIAEVTKIASEAVSANDIAGEIVLKGLIDTINTITIAADEVYNRVKTTSEAKNASVEVTVQTIDDSITLAKQLIGIAGWKSYEALGAATEICEVGARPILNEAIQIVTRAKIIAYKGFESVRSIVFNGVDAGEDAINQALWAAVKAIQATVEAADKVIIMAGKKAFKAISNESNLLDEINPLELARTQAAEHSPQCQNAIENINVLADDTLEYSLSAPQIAAVKVIRNGFVAACKTIANAAQSGYKSMKDAKSILNEESALSTVQKGIDASKKESIAAVAHGYHALGSAAQIIGQSSSVGQDGLQEAVKMLEGVRAQISDGLDAAQTVATLGIQSTAAKAGLDAGYESIESAGYSSYAAIERIAKTALDAIVSIGED